MARHCSTKILFKVRLFMIFFFFTTLYDNIIVVLHNGYLLVCCSSKPIIVSPTDLLGTLKTSLENL